MITRSSQLLRFGLAVDDVVQRLAHNRLGHTQALGHVADLGDAPAAEIGHAPVTDLALLQQITDGPHGFFQRHAVVFAVQVVDIQVIGTHARQAGFDGIEQMLARQPAAVGQAVHCTESRFGGNHPVLPVARHRLANDLLRAPAVVDVGGIDKVDALIPGLVDDPQRILGAGLLAEHHAAQGQG